ncbi:MAG: Cytochrome bd terminal oxidase subunit II, partial [uncultured Blastococcus sp.]
GPADALVRRRRGALDRLPAARGLRLRGRRPAAGARPEAGRPAPDAPQHRAAVGRQRGLADHRRRRGVRRLPRLVRHLAAGALPALRAGLVRPDHPGGGVRVAALPLHRGVGRDVDPGHHRRVADRLPRHRRRPGRDDPRPADRRRRHPRRRRPLRAGLAGAAGSGGGARLLPGARRHVPGAEDRRAAARRGPHGRPPVGSGRRAAAAALGGPGAPAVRHAGHRGAVAGRGPGRGGCLGTDPGGPGGAGIRRVGRDAGRRRGHDLRRRLSRRPALDPGRRVRRDRRRRVGQRLHADGHDLGRRRRAAGGPGLPGVDLLGLPHAPHRRSGAPV